MLLPVVFKGKIYPINPKKGKILNLKVYENISDIKDDIDIVCIAIPAKFVFSVIKRLCQKKDKICNNYFLRIFRNRQY